MTKEQFCAKWEFSSYWKADLEAVIANEIAKAKEAKLKHADQVTDQVTDQVQNTKPFDKDRFEAMFRAVVASGRNEGYDADFEETEKALTKLDAYYATKEGGENE